MERGPIMNSIDEVTTQIDHDFHQSIISVRQLFSQSHYNTFEKKVIAKRILARLEDMKKEVEIWSK